MRKSPFLVFFECKAICLVTLALVACSDNGTNAAEFNAASVCPQSGRGTFVDERDGQVYKYTTIGNQVWMAQNLSYSIPEAFVLDPETNEQVESVIHCYEDDCVHSGNVYNWYAAYYSCPVGWHLPSEDEWRTLIKEMGGEEGASARLRATSGWKVLNRGENPNGTDDCGFSLAPVKDIPSDTTNIKYELYVWTSSDYGDSERMLYVDVISYRKEFIFNSVAKTQDNITVRCIMD
jgi:uncharacterized protein (TIGR02145 family)